MNASRNPILISDREIQDRVTELGRRISEDYSGRAVTMVSVLKGSFIFTADLIRRIDPQIAVEICFISISSYGANTTSSGTIDVREDLAESVLGKDVIVVEDIVDSGRTLRHVVGMLAEKGARSIRIAALLEKPGKTYDGPIDYVGFQIPRDFVVGYGLDHAGLYRNLGDIRILNEP